MTLRIASCHCGAVTLRFPLEDFTSVRRCDCSFCRRRGAIAASVPIEKLEVSGAEHLALYEWGTKTAKHYFCKTCGIYTHHRRRSNPSEYGINVGNIYGINPRDLGEIPWSDGANHPSDRQT
ncbi:GFA family protein [Phytohalomonas tamaricis]|uniref:GFA family protein n=1 Tax=Phytohalomonas tamaricis TaxID=2081032 RepID=UPI000D0B9111|nr:GFA family protein [Phytohalomonas tamaricis]